MITPDNFTIHTSPEYSEAIRREVLDFTSRNGRESWS